MCRAPSTGAQAELDIVQSEVIEHSSMLLTPMRLTLCSPGSAE